MVDLGALTRDDFAACLNGTFRVMDDPAAPVDLQLFEVPPSRVLPRQVAFSILFHGPADRFLPQRIHTLVNDRLGELDIFLVPVGQDEQGYVYEAIFNRLLKKEQGGQ